MKNFYPKIKFVYSLPYNGMLAEYEKKDFDGEKNFKEIKEYIKKLQPKWRKIEKSVCRALQEIVKNKWKEKEIKCYVVKYCKYSGISGPLTIRMEPDFGYVFDTLIHELTHILVGYDFEKYKKIEEKLKKKFHGQELRIIRHIYINFIELQVLRKLFSPEIVNEIIKRNLTFKGIGKAWEIVLNEENDLKRVFKA